MKDDSDPELSVFTEALKLPAQERPAFLQRACGGDEALRSKVEALLKAHEHVGDFLEEPPTQASDENDNLRNGRGDEDEK